ncbi:TPA: hypothetical protein DCR49_11320 [Candidatus Delongbacteria bacterium]|nr:MAG: hypothetical protein A2Y39_02025 [Candidatus Delongbacteria bacterium GWF2_40_14]HAQ62562.1 hypothetical protein [Candidatus Delongbacteria bacterium]
MMNNVILWLLFTALSLDILYIIFRNPNINRMNIVIYPIAIILSLKTFCDTLTLMNFAKLSSLTAVFAAMTYFENRSYEKPDYRYLLVLLGTIIINLIK